MAAKAPPFDWMQWTFLSCSAVSSVIWITPGHNSPRFKNGSKSTDSCLDVLDAPQLLLHLCPKSRPNARHFSERKQQYWTKPRHKNVQRHVAYHLARHESEDMKECEPSAPGKKTGPRTPNLEGMDMNHQFAQPETIVKSMSTQRNKDQLSKSNQRPSTWTPFVCRVAYASDTNSRQKRPRVEHATSSVGLSAKWVIRTGKTNKDSG